MIGIVTVTYNSASVLREFLRDLVRQSHRDFRLYMVDNASKDETLELAAVCQDSRVQVIANTENVGVAEGNNIGIRRALADGCDRVLLINNDTEFGPKLLAELIAGMEEQRCEMVVPTMLFGDGQRVWCAGGSFHKLRGYSVKHWAEGQQAQECGGEPREVEYTPTCCMLIERRVFDKIGLMDARYFVYFDDADFCYRANKAGFRLVLLPRAVIRHKVSSLTGGGQSTFTVRYLTRNRVFFVLKNLGWAYAMYFLPLYQAYILLRLLTGRDTAEVWRVRERAFREGLRVGRMAATEGA